MTQQHLNFGSPAPDDGESPFSAFTKIEANFNDLYSSVARSKLTAARTYYVDPAGNDANTGLAQGPSGAFATIQKGINTIAALDTGGQAVQVQCADGSYAPFKVSGPFVGDVGAVTVTGSPPVAITGATNATPIVITAPGHNYANGDHVVISGVGGNAAANGAFKVGSANIGAGMFALTKEVDGSNVAGNGAYTSGGNVQAPSRCTIAATGAPGTDASIPVQSVNFGLIQVSGFKLTSTQAMLALAADYGNLVFGKMQYDAVGSGFPQLWGTRYGRVRQTDYYSIGGSGGNPNGNLFQASHAGQIRQESSTGFAIANLAYDQGSQAVLFCDAGEILTTASPSATPFSANGFTVTGKKWAISEGGNLQVEGYSPPRDSYIFGNASGIQNSTPKVIAITRDLTLAAGNQAVTGVGYKPTALIATGGVNATSYATFCGMASRAAGGSAGQSDWYEATSGAAVNALFIQVTDATGSHSEWATINSWDDDGFTLAWAKSGSPTGTATFYIMCFP